MESEQYEELCRHFIAEKTSLSVEEVRSGCVQNPQRPGLAQYKHQIDLYWDTGYALAKYFNIANAKWRGSTKIEQGEVLLLQQVCQEVAAHKAFMISNVGFTAGAVAVAQHHGIALHCVVPNFDTSSLPRGDRAAIQEAIRDKSSCSSNPLYSFDVEHRGLGFRQESTSGGLVVDHSEAPRRTSYTARVVQPPSRSIPGASSNRSDGRGEARAGLGPRPGARDGGFVKK